MREQALVRGESKISTLESSRTIFRIAGSLLQIFFLPPPLFLPIPLQLNLTSSLIITSLSLYLSGVVSNHNLARRAKRNVCKPWREHFRVVTQDKAVTSQAEAVVMIRHRLSAISQRILSHISKRESDIFWSSWEDESVQC